MSPWLERDYFRFEKLERLHEAMALILEKNSSTIIAQVHTGYPRTLTKCGGKNGKDGMIGWGHAMGFGREDKLLGA